MSTEKLLVGDEEEGVARPELVMDEAQKEGCIRNTRICSSLVGWSIGVFIQFSSLALNFFLTKQGKPEDAPCPLQTYAVASCIWSMFSSFMGVSVLLLMRSMVVNLFYSANSYSEEPETFHIKEDFMVAVINNLEQFFSMGTVFGVAAAWAATDLVLGITPPLFQNLLVFLIAGVWYIIMPRNSHA